MQPQVITHAKITAHTKHAYIPRPNCSQHACVCVCLTHYCPMQISQPQRCTVTHSQLCAAELNLGGKTWIITNVGASRFVGKDAWRTAVAHRCTCGLLTQCQPCNACPDNADAWPSTSQNSLYLKRARMCKRTRRILEAAASALQKTPH